MKSMKYFVLICMGCLMIASVSAFTSYNDSLGSAFSNKIETVSSMTLTVGKLDTSLGNKFISNSADSGIELFNTVDVSSYSSDLPSKGTVSAYLKGSIKEGGRVSVTDPVSTDLLTIKKESPNDLSEMFEFFDFTSISGDIFTFNKHMSYSSILG